MDPSHLSEALRRLWWWVWGVDRSTDSTLCARCRPWIDPEKLEHARILYLHSNKTAADVCRPVGIGRPPKHCSPTWCKSEGGQTRPLHINSSNIEVLPPCTRILRVSSSPPREDWSPPIVRPNLV